MTNEEFDALVLKLEDHARKDPAGYRIRVALLAFLGNAYLAIVLLVVGLLFLLSLASILQLKVIGVKIAVVTGIFLWILIRALWIKLLPPQGFEVTR